MEKATGTRNVERSPSGPAALPDKPTQILLGLHSLAFLGEVSVQQDPLNYRLIPSYLFKCNSEYSQNWAEGWAAASNQGI